MDALAAQERGAPPLPGNARPLPPAQWSARGRDPVTLTLRDAGVRPRTRAGGAEPGGVKRS